MPALYRQESKARARQGLSIFLRLRIDCFGHLSDAEPKNVDPCGRSSTDLSHRHLFPRLASWCDALFHAYGDISLLSHVVCFKMRWKWLLSSEASPFLVHALRVNLFLVWMRCGTVWLPGGAWCRPSRRRETNRTSSGCLMLGVKRLVSGADRYDSVQWILPI